MKLCEYTKGVRADAFFVFAGAERSVPLNRKCRFCAFEERVAVGVGDPMPVDELKILRALAGEKHDVSLARDRDRVSYSLRAVGDLYIIARCAGLEGGGDLVYRFTRVLKIRIVGCEYTEVRKQ